MSSLVKIVKEVASLETMLIESGGELTPEIEAMLTVKEVNLPEKVDSYEAMLDRLSVIESLYKERAKLFSQAAKSLGNAQDTLKDRIKYAMKELGVTELLGHDIRFKLSSSKPKLVIEDEKAIPKEYKAEVITVEVQKDKLLEDLKIGSVEGARLEESFSLRTYVNKKG